MTWQEGNVAYVRTINPIRECPSNAHKLAIIVYEALEHTVRERGFQTVGSLVSKRRSTVERGKFVPVETVNRV
jgi:hypothetical protein